MMEALGDETTTRRTVRSAVALSTLPTIWAEYEPHQVLERLADVLQRTLSLEFVCICVHGQSPGQAIEFCRTNRQPTPAGQTEQLGRALAPWLDRMRSGLVESLPNPLGHGTVRIVGLLIGSEGAQWILVAGSARANFPTGDDRLLLSIATNQAAMLLQRKQVEVALRRSEALLTEAQTLAHVGSWNWDLARDSVAWSDEHYRIFGLAPQAMPMNFDRVVKLVHPDDRSTVQAVVDKALRDGEPFEYSLRAAHPDGAIRIVQARGQVEFDENGQPLRIFGTVQDVTERARAEESLRESELRFRGTFENAAVGIAHRDLTGCWLRINQTFCDIVGYTRERLLGISFRDITHPDDLLLELAHDQQLCEGRVPSYSIEKRYLRSDGAAVWVDLSASLQRDAAGNPAYVITVIEDISERKRLEADLRQAKEVAEKANRTKDEFLANVSHEIRTPLNAILGMAEVVLGTPLAIDQRQDVETLKSAAESLLEVINDLLDISRIEAGKIELYAETFSLRTAVRDTLRALAFRAQQKGLELCGHVQADVPDELVGDVVRLRQALINLVDNAIKFTERGKVSLCVEVTDESVPDDAFSLRFVVSDTGIGIPRDKQAIIFEAFQQEDTSIIRKYGGTGLGLTIAARLVALMGGRISVASERGRGSTFTFTVQFPRISPLDQGAPLQPIEAAAPCEPALAVKPESLRILLAEDNEFNVRHVQRLLTRKGHRIEVAATGREALQVLETEGRNFDLMLLDLHMPEVDGLQVVQAIRQREIDSGGHLPVIALTARSTKEDRDRCLTAGADDYLSKPVRAVELFAALERVRAASRPSLIDMGVLVAGCANDPTALAQMCQDFRASVPGRFADVAAAMHARNGGDLREAAHKLCGLLSAFSTAAGELASRLEDHAALQELDEAGELVNRLDTMIHQLTAELNGVRLESGELPFGESVGAR